MTEIILKVRNLIEDKLKTEGRDVFTYESINSSKIFTLTEGNVSSSTIVVQKNGIVWSLLPVAGTGVAWTRVLAVITITKTAHGLITGDSVTITASNSTSALPLGTYLVTKLTDNTFTVVGLNAGATSGTCTYTTVSNYSYSTTTGKLTLTGNVTVGDSFELTYSYYSKYSDNELRGNIKGALSYLSVEKYKTFAAKSDNIIIPTPNESEENLIAVIAAILIKGNVISYRTPELTVTFERGDSKEKMIKKFIRQFRKAYGVLEYIDLGENMTDPDEEIWEQ
jgi:hypothetical protein